MAIQKTILIFILILICTQPDRNGIIIYDALESSYKNLNVTFFYMEKCFQKVKFDLHRKEVSTLFDNYVSFATCECSTCELFINYVTQHELFSDTYPPTLRQNRNNEPRPHRPTHP